MTVLRFVTEEEDSGVPLRQVPKPGSFGLARIGGLTGKLVAAAQAFAGDGSRFTHAFVVLDNGECIEAEPGGARIVPLRKYLEMEEVAFIDTPVVEYMQGRMDSVPAGFQPVAGPTEFWDYVEELKREGIVKIARSLEHTKYGYLQYLYMGVLALSGKDGSLDQPRGWFTRWLAKRITDRGSLICSQLVDFTYERAGIKLFKDERLPQNVTPGDLAIRFGIG